MDEDGEQNLSPVKKCEDDEHMVEDGVNGEKMVRITTPKSINLRK